MNSNLLPSDLAVGFICLFYLHCNNWHFSCNHCWHKNVTDGQWFLGWVTDLHTVVILLWFTGEKLKDDIVYIFRNSMWVNTFWLSCPCVSFWCHCIPPPPTNIGLDLGILWMCITFTITLHDVVTYDVNDNLVFVAILLLIERVRVTESCDTPSNIGASSL